VSGTGRTDESMTAPEPTHRRDGTCAHTVDVGYVHVLAGTDFDGPCAENCPHPDHREKADRG
jgi:hypothetical protein